MPTMLMDEGRYLHITIADSVRDCTFFVNKEQIRKIDMPNDDMVRICVGDNPAHTIIVTASDVSNPAGLADVKQVREYLVTISKTEFAGMATAINQEGQTAQMEEMKSLLEDIKEVLTVYNPANIFNQPLIMDNSTGGTTYYGYAVAGTAVNAAGWAIKKVVVSGPTTNILWTNGNFNLNTVWNNRASYTYAAANVEG